MSKTKITVAKSDMSDEMQREALECALLAVNMYDSSKDIAVYIKKEFDRRYQPSWQCIVGSCGSLVSHSRGCYLRFTVGNETIMLFKTS
ncbi:dynein light chain 1, cytoplasmic-like [Puntigrus tetrazona]|uniref:dynein light chain 1, cytoplasmic-like n=1 Tax=Puntigrus tetrazona TaxID=1606681 RepID=UPI001C8AA22A|nr:dynein light chain 1, cytoplasmic-like [Puntigrus tetrazona]